MLISTLIQNYYHRDVLDAACNFNMHLKVKNKQKNLIAKADRKFMTNTIISFLNRNYNGFKIAYNIIENRKIELEFFQE